MINKAIKNVLQSVKYPDIEYNSTLPSKLRQSGTLTGRSAERFSQRARDYVDDFKQSIKSYIKNLISSLKTMNIGENIFKKYQKDIDDFEKDLKNQKLAIEEYGRIVKALKELNFKNM